MESGQNNRSELYKIAPDNIKGLYAGEETGDLLWRIAAQIGITGGSKYRMFALSIGDVILGLYKKTSLPQILKDRVGLDEKKIAVAMSGLKSLLDQIPETTSAINSVITPQTAEQVPINSTDKVQTTESIMPGLTAVKPMRTFSDDFNAGRAHGYGAFHPQDQDDDPDESVHRTSQDDIIKK